MKPRILHLTADYPDRFQSAKTPAIAGLVEGTAEQFEHFVISLNREGSLNGLMRPGHVLDDHHGGQVLAVRYAAPPAVVGIIPAMNRLADWLVQELGRIGFKPDLIQGHKLTIEGLLARLLAVRLGVPYVLTLQGNTDQKLLTSRPDRIQAIQQVWSDARGIMAFAPWTAAWFSRRLGDRPNPVAVIPCILPHDSILGPQISEQMVRTAFHLDAWQNKNIVTLLKAIKRISPQFPALRLEIAGGGSPKAIAAIAAKIAKMGLEDRVRLVGPVAPEAIQGWFREAAVFALPALRESFGMVFAEALLAGTPVIYPKGAAIDGFFLDRAFATRVIAQDPGSVANALASMLTRQAAAKADLAAAQQAGELNRFRRSEVLNAYTRFLRQACSPTSA